MSQGRHVSDLSFLSLCLLSFLLSTKSVLAQYAKPLAYPRRPHRYFRLGPNYNAQECYVEEDIALMQRIKTAYETILGEESENYFSLKEEKYWHDWWSCTKPFYNKLLKQHPQESFTLPSREAEDGRLFPLWNFADNMARQIANWQGERVKEQTQELMNDPVMLIFEELRNWFFNDLGRKECKPETLLELGKRVSFLKSLIHLVPNFGPDRLHLLELQKGLEHASNLVQHCIANKALPHLLSDLVRTGVNLENTLATYLHFLLVNEEVSDNFSIEYLEGTQRYCQQSPVCKIYQSAKAIQLAQSLPNDYVSKFYSMIDTSTDSNQSYLKLEIKKSALEAVKFASFVGEQEKIQYMETIATLDALINVRKILEKFHSVQTKLGTYIFAASYYEKANELAENYINLINKSRTLTKSLLKTSDSGLSLLLEKHNKYKNKDQLFEKNLRTLETKVAKGTTVSAQLDSYCDKSIESMQKYQQALKKLSADFFSGNAQHELEKAMHDLFLQMHHMNTFLPGILQGKNVVVTDLIVAEPANELPQQDMQCVSAIIDDKVDRVFAIPFDYGKWNAEITYDEETGTPIFTYQVYQQNRIVGSADFYGEPMLCVSEDKTRHNILNLQGVLRDFKLTNNMHVDEICSVLPSTLFDKVLIAGREGAAYGCLRGASQVIAVTLKNAGVSPYIANLVKQASFYSGTFAMKFSYYYAQREDMEEMERCFQAIYHAAIETGQLWVLQLMLNQISNLLENTSAWLEKWGWSKTASGLNFCSNYLRFGLYAWQTIKSGWLPTTASLASGIAVETLISKGSDLLLDNKKPA